MNSKKLFRGRAVSIMIVAVTAGALTTSCSSSDDSDVATSASEVADSPEGDEADRATSTDASSASAVSGDQSSTPSAAPEASVATSTAPVEPAPTSETDQSTSGSDPSGDDATAVTPPPVRVPGPTVTASLDEDVPFGTGVSATVVEVESVDVVGRLPGERSGPGVVVTVEVTNASSDPISLDLVIVDLIGGDGASAVPIGSASTERLTGELEPGQSEAGQYQYFIPPDLRQSATIAISYSADAPTALFTGALPDA